MNGRSLRASQQVAAGPWWVAYLSGERGPGPTDSPTFPFGDTWVQHRFTDAGGIGVRVWFEDEPIAAVRIDVVGPLAPAAAFRRARALTDELEQAVGGYANLAIGLALQAALVVPTRATGADETEAARRDVLARLETVLERHIGAGEQWTGPGWCRPGR